MLEITAHLHFEDLAHSIFNQKSNALEFDVRIHCAEGKIINANKQILSLGSSLFRSILSSDCDCSTFLPIVYDVICPEFQKKTLGKVIESIQTGRNVIECQKENDMAEIKSIVETLQIDVLVEENKARFSNKNPSRLNTSRMPKNHPKPSGSLPTFVKIEEEDCMTMDLDDSTSRSFFSFSDKQSDPLSVDYNDSNVDSMSQFENEELERANYNYLPTVTRSETADGRKQFKCDYCEKSYGYKGQLQNHIMIVHEGKRPFECEICLKSFTSKHHLKAHISEVHQKIKPHECNFCSKKFSRSTHLRGHILRQHSF